MLRKLWFVTAVCLVMSSGFMPMAMPMARAMPSINHLTPSALFVQIGIGDNQTQSYQVGAAWNWHWSKEYQFGTVTGFSEASFGRWITTTDKTSGATWATQLGITPVFRFQPAILSSDYFAELGIGANYILPLYHSREKRFSTQFNFGDHIAVGRWFGHAQQHEVEVRFQHFSNAGIDHPNPGENFFQLRYTRHFE